MHMMKNQIKPILNYKPNINLMKKINLSILSNKPSKLIAMVCLLFLGSITTALASFTCSVTSPQTTYTPGVSNTLTFNISVQYNGTFEYVDRLQLAFPAGVVVNSATPVSGSGGCATNAGVQGICSPAVSWYTAFGGTCNTAFTGSGCGPYYSIANSPFTVMVTIPANFTGPMIVTLNARGDGYPTGVPSTQALPVTFQQAVAFVPCAPVCPANIEVTLDPGACSAILNYAVTTTGDCFIGGTLSGFTGGYAPSAINYYQYDAGIFTNPPTPFTNGYAITFNSPTNTTLKLISSDFGFSPGPTLYYFNGIEWTNTTAATQNVSFNWTYTTNDGAFWDHFDYMVGTAAQNFANSNFGNQENLWTQISNANGTNSQMGTSMIAVPGGRRLALAAYTLDAGGGPCTVNISNFAVSQILPAVPVQTSGLPSGSAFPIGTTQNCYKVTANNAAGTAVTTSCCFNVTVHEFPNPSSTLACNDNVEVSVNDQCEAFVSTSMILSGDVYHCYDDYIVSIQGYGSGAGGVLINSSAVGQTLTVTVYDPDTGNSCWGTISVEDKIPPTIECRAVTLLCGEPLPTIPAPELVGYQNILYTGLNDLVDNNSFTYNFDFNYLPAGTPVLDVDVRIKIDDHTWLPDLQIDLTSPSGLTKTIMTIGGCILQEWPINCIFDDAGATITLCMELNTPGGTGRLKPLIAGVSTLVLFNFNGLDAHGIWKVRIADNAVGDDGHIREVGVFINVNLPQVDPADNCGEVETTFTDTQSGDPCDAVTITRHWVATDQSGNTAACDQIITVLPLVLDSVDCPPAYVGHCGESTLPTHTGWPSVNGTPITDQNSVCNIFVGYWDKPLNDCGNGIKIVRTWTILDWCTQTTLECIQVIKLADDQPPVISCPSNITVGTDFWYCYASVSVPKPNVVDACGSAFTLSLAATGGHIVNFGNNYVINQIPLGTITVTWTATDECNNKSSCSFTITVVDDVVPVANCDAHTVVALTNDGPFGITLVPASVFNDGSYDNCGPVTFRARRMDSCIDFDWTTEGACIDDIPGGVPPVNSRDRGTVSRPCVPFACCDVGAADPIMVELEVTDAAGNRNFCMVEAVVQDKISPFVQCPPDITVSCDFWFNVQEGTFSDSPINHAGNGNGNLDEDPLSPVFGNMYDAFQYNDDQSVRQDIIINDPGNPHVNQPHFWGIDGWADDNCQVNLQVRVRVVNDCSGDDLPPGAPAGAVKLVERRFSASDGGQGIAPGTCTQRIWVVDFDPFTITDVTCGLYNNDDVVWPCDVLLTTCPDDLGDTGEPIIYDDACSLVGVAYEDQRFDFVDGACYKILRTWSVIDWCQYNSLTGEGLWHYTQVIKVHDKEGPVFLTCPSGPVTLCVADTGGQVTLPDNNQAFLGHNNPLSSSCSVHLKLSQVVHESCSDLVNYDVKLYLYNGDDFIYVKPLSTVETDSNHLAVLTFNTRQNSIKEIRDNGIPYNSPFCGDYHKLLWSAEDGCGNWSHCEYLIRLEDCKQPSPVCINGLSTVVMPIGGQVTIWAKDFNASSFDDCTAEEDLLYSFSGDSYQPSYSYTCGNVPAFGVELAVEIWVADGGVDHNCNGQISWSERNKDYCTTTIVITDNNGVCGDTTGGSVLLAGQILTDDAQSVEKAAVTLTSPGHVFPTYVTVQDGKFNFHIVPADYTINVERNDAYRNGVSTLDLVRIQKHLLGIEPFTSPYDLIAADANNSQSVSAIDLVELRKLILGIYTELPANKSWRFVDKSFQFADATHPWPFTEAKNVNMAGNDDHEDFVAVKIGDVNNTVQANAQQVLPRNAKGVVSFVADDRMVSTGEMVDLAIRSTDFASIEGFQYTLQTQGLEFRGVEAGLVSMSDENLGVFGSTITASWHKVGGVSATSSDVLYTLRFQATAPGRLSDMVTLNSKETQAEAYNTQDDIKDLKLSFRGAEHGAEFALYQNEPNPFKDNTVIGYDLPQAGPVTLTIFDVTGKVLMVKDQESVKGYNTIAVSRKDMPSVGVLYYRLDANEYTATKKMVIIE